MNIAIRIASLSAIALVAACTTTDDSASSAAADGRQCFFPSQVTGFTSAGRGQIHVHTGPRQVFLFETMGPCPDLDFSESLGFDHRGSSMICSGLDVTLVIPSPTVGPRRCPVRMIRKLTEEEVAAMRR